MEGQSGHWSGTIGSLRPNITLLAAERWNVGGEPVQGLLANFMAAEVEVQCASKILLCHHDTGCRH